MSHAIRSSFSVPVTQAVQCMADADTLLAENPRDLKKISVLSVKFEKIIKSLKEKVDRWTVLLSELEGEALTAEETRFDNFRSSDQKPVDLIANMEFKLVDLEVAMVELKMAANGGANNANGGPNNEQNQANPPAQTQFLPLPKPTLLTFDGNMKEWAAFWQNFEDNVGNNKTLSDAQRLHFLIGQLRGPPKEMTGGYRLINESYQPVVEALKNRYGDEDKVAEELQQEFINLPRATMSPSSLRSLLESVEKICRQLTAKTPEGTLHGFVDSSFFIATLKDKLPRELKVAFLRRENGGAKWTAKEWRKNFAIEVKIAEEAQGVQDKNKPPEPKFGHQNHQKSGQNSSNNIKRAFPVPNQKGKKAPHCFLCKNDGHWPLLCPIFDTALKRKDKLKELNRCFDCLSTEHQSKDCKKDIKCPVQGCGKKHNKIICFKFKPNGSMNIPQNNNSKNFGTRNQNKGNGGKGQNGASQMANGSNATPLFSNQTTLNSGVFSVVNAAKAHSFLMVGHIPIWTGNGTETVPVFFDTGSQSSFITNSLARRIGCQKVGQENLCVGGLIGNSPAILKNIRSSVFRTMMKREDGGWEEVFLAGLDKITPKIDCLVRPNNDFEYEIDDPIFGRVEPKIMIGIRQFWRFFLSKEEIRPGVYKISTVFGDVFCGQDETNAFCGAFTNFSGPVLEFPKKEDPIEKMWNLETLGIRDCPLENDEEKAILLFQKSLKKDEEGRFEVSWPWKSDSRPPDNFNLAFSRLNQLVPKLRANPQLHQGYQEIFDDYLKKGIISISKKNGFSEHFLPHHPVLGKKLRIVFAADAHTRGQPSLNDCLLTGPNLIPDLAEILIRFRATKIPVLADVQQAFLTLGLNSPDREFVKFLWPKNINKPLNGDNLIVFQFCRVPFGVVSSPFLLNATTREFLKNHSDPKIRELNKNLFVDNLLAGGENIQEANEIALKAKNIFTEAHMNLRDFVSNKIEALTGLKEEDYLATDRANCPVLGLKWDIENEELVFNLPEPEKLTEFDNRRSVLSTKSLMFDPLGLCSPVMFESKLFFQKIWGKTKIGTKNWKIMIKNYGIKC
jgi:hypothetical protein